MMICKLMLNVMVERELTQHITNSRRIAMVACKSPLNTMDFVSFENPNLMDDVGQAHILKYMWTRVEMPNKEL